jgi:hypothetical protein
LAAPLACAIGEHVGHATGFTGVNFFQFIEAEQIVIVRQCHALRGVRRAAPAL